LIFFQKDLNSGFYIRIYISIVCTKTLLKKTTFCRLVLQSIVILIQIQDQTFFNHRFHKFWRIVKAALTRFYRQS